jgi:hypothetical protein
MKQSFLCFTATHFFHKLDLLVSPISPSTLHRSSYPWHPCPTWPQRGTCQLPIAPSPIVPSQERPPLPCCSLVGVPLILLPPWTTINCRSH